MRTRVRLSTLLVGGLLVAIAWPGVALAGKATIYRDTWGVPNIYADSEESACFAMGYAQAEDRPQQIFDNYRTGIGRAAEVLGPGELEKDFVARAFRHAEVSKERYNTASPKVRACIEAFQDGVRHYFEKHPEKKTASHMDLEPWMCLALGRAVIWGWPLGQAGEDLIAGGVNPPRIEYHGSNEMAISPSRTKEKVAMAVIDPHLGFYGPMRFYEARMYAGDLACAGTAVVGQPMISLGHNAYISVAMTTGGPDTADVFIETINPDNPAQYQYDGKWRDGKIETLKIAVKTKDGKIDTVTKEILYTHHGPVIATKDGKGYAMALAYQNEVGLADQMYGVFRSKNIEEVKAALAMAQLMPQNVMVTCRDGDIYYQRTGRVPIRPDGYNYSRPVPGDTSATEWKGIHPTSDLVQILNPECGWMQNCNVSPRVMFRDSPLTEDKYKSYIYEEPTYMGIRYGLHQRAAETFHELDQAKDVTIEDWLQIALSPVVYGVKPWQERLEKAWAGADAETKGDEKLAQFVKEILTWNGRADKDSTGILPYKYWKDQQGAMAKLRNRLGAPPDALLTDGGVIKMVKDGYKAMMDDVGRIDVKYGDIYRTGRRGGKRTAPAEGGGINGIATPRSLGFGGKDKNGQHLMDGGQCAPEVVVWTKPPQSWTAAPLGQSDDPVSPHFDDQAIKLVSNRKMKSTYFKNKAELMKNLESTTELTYEK
ncbi:MAG: penicillin acylase family protein [Phycisphaerae bacterium]|nr:penicillin acylase family protein [Phycisphaerae bacterium]